MCTCYECWLHRSGSLGLCGGLQAVEVRIVRVSMVLLAAVLTPIGWHFTGLREAVGTWFDHGLVAWGCESGFATLVGLVGAIRGVHIPASPG